MNNLPIRILLVEDDCIDQIVFKRLIKSDQLNYDYTISSSVAEAKEQLRVAKFDAVILDYDLGDGTAFDLLDDVSDTPIIFTTGAGDEETAVRAMRSGVFDYLIKDLDKNYIKLLPSIIENAIKNKRDKKQLDMLSKAMMSIKDSVYITDMDFRVKFVNNAFCKTYGYEECEILGSESIDLWNNPRDFHEAENYLSKKGTGEYYHIRKNGDMFPVSISRCIVKDDNQMDSTVINVIRDITESKEIDKMKSEFVNTVSHEIRTPLTVMLSLSQLLLANTSMSEEKLKKYYQTMYKETKRLTDLVNDFLDIQRMESGKQVFNKEKTCIVDIVDEVLSIYEMSESREIIVDMDKVDYAPIFADMAKMVQLLTNLLSNAIKYSPEGDAVKMIVRETDSDIVVSIIDKGLGIPEESLPMLFTKFYRVDNSDHRKVGGTGLGLVICKEIVNAHDGTIGVKSTFNEGSEFYFTIPKLIEDGGYQ